MKIYIFITILLIVLSFLYFKLAIKFKIIDKPNQRSSHTKITVRGGGIIFPISILLFFISNDYQYSYFILGVVLISIVSFLDDMYTLSSKVRFPFQLLAVFLVLVQLNTFSLPFYLPMIFLFLGLAIINMFNFMDGVNGITGFYSLIVISSFYILNLSENLISDDLFIYSIISIIIFCFYNFRKKALFFGGDIGSISIGLLLFFIGLYYTINFKSPLFLLTVIVYGADAGNTLIYRKLFTEESIFEPHRHHLYQKLVDFKIFSHLQVSLVYGLIQLIVNLILLQFYKTTLFIQWTLFFGLIFCFILFYIFSFKKLKLIKSNLS
ncbi:hypothetical protein [Polaribacter dokdonensis]|uniref:UDP-N-acetylmuramyl pentapeptide phosphotransferase/UDP-N-acetylglucosamine-1-phosphate transferase n=1 Tax=Polaribacter dokdonensis DSW-5 TaxID=1300348 RepID=A0A0M9CEP3_9FLAO|nr:hypothetical protein [Polaribacter dokdonensis]KOY50649.1 UDP-N-acetylmuramyl pentapeptide phosphotransferase/UDP-N-acetylglucosamine-1-phosphate transferase [Polaribacter dokdonensis DSW-5]SEE62220.1 UDP-N-acetylmuramyl pentapeptide phosphotransferase/UDP-N-acetylglucosamine-1-phosphate transferase [Polaribacter dokdonensis DSW-5]